MDIRKYGIAIAVAILSAILIYAIADAVAPPANYDGSYKAMTYGADPVRAVETKCTNVPIDRAAEKTCQDGGYAYEAVYSADGCVDYYQCNTCYKEQQDLDQQRRQTIFYIAIGLGLLFVIIGFLLPLGSIHEWVGLGFIIGGVLGLFVGTVQYWSDLSRWLRPLVVFLELVVLLAIVYRRMQPRDADEAPAVVSPAPKRRRAR